MVMVIYYCWPCSGQEEQSTVVINLVVTLQILKIVWWDSGIAELTNMLEVQNREVENAKELYCCLGKIRLYLNFTSSPANVLKRFLIYQPTTNKQFFQNTCFCVSLMTILIKWAVIVLSELVFLFSVIIQQYNTVKHNLINFEYICTAFINYFWNLTPDRGP